MAKTMAQGRGNSGTRRGKLRRKAGFRIARREGIGRPCAHGGYVNGHGGYIPPPSPHHPPPSPITPHHPPSSPIIPNHPQPSPTIPNHPQPSGTPWPWLWLPPTMTTHAYSGAMVTNVPTFPLDTATVMLYIITARREKTPFAEKGGKDA